MVTEQKKDYLRYLLLTSVALGIRVVKEQLLREQKIFMMISGY